MGIKKLHTFLEENDLIIQHKEFKNFLINKKTHSPNYRFNKQLIVGVDFFVYVYKFNYSCDNMFYGFVTQILKFLSNGIIPIYIIDGKSTEHKEDTIKDRRIKQNKLEDRWTKLKKEINEIESKLSAIQEMIQNTEQQTDHTNSNFNGMNLEESEIEYLEKLLELTDQEQKIKKSIFKITKDDIAKIYKIFQIFKIPFIKAKGEADFLCAKLYTEGFILSCLSTDTDLLPLGCASVIQFKRGKLIEYDLDHILQKLNINYNQFVDFCVLLGCDYLKTPPSIDYKRAFTYIKKFKTIENIIKIKNRQFNSTSYCTFMEKYQVVRDIYICSGSNESIPSDFKLTTDKLDKQHIINSLTSLECIENKNCKYVVSRINVINRNRDS
jgi:5'-3' exonuclease